MKTGQVQLIATAAFGIEAPLRREVERLSGVCDISGLDGRVCFCGGAELIAEANINLSCADRVYLEVAKFNAETFDALYDNTFSAPWENWIVKEGKFAVSGKSVGSQLSSVPAIQKIVKKAISDKLMKVYNAGWLYETGAEYPVLVSVIRNEVVLSIDTSGAGLHKRGYRIKTYSAPLKETLAAALLDLSFYRGNKVFADPFCGSGTIAIEATLKARDIAPGLNRQFVCQSWKNLDAAIWKNAYERARGKIITAPIPPIFASDISPAAIKLAKENAANAGVEKDIVFKTADFKTADLPESGVIVCNPPYAERLGGDDEVRDLYRTMGKRLKNQNKTALNVLTGFSGFDKIFGKKPDKMRKIYNGNLQTFFYQYFSSKEQD